MKKFVAKPRDHWDVHMLRVELGLGLAISGVVIVMFCWGEQCQVMELLSDNRAKLYSALASIAGALLGFSITALSIVWPAFNHENMRIVRESGDAERLWKIFHSANR